MMGGKRYLFGRLRLGHLFAATQRPCVLQGGNNSNYYYYKPSSSKFSTAISSGSQDDVKFNEFFRSSKPFPLYDDASQFSVAQKELHDDDDDDDGSVLGVTYDDEGSNTFADLNYFFKRMSGAKPYPLNDFAYDAAQFAVTEINSKKNTSFELAKVITAHQERVAGVILYIILEATHTGKKNKFIAGVWIRRWMKQQKYILLKWMPGRNIPSSFCFKHGSTFVPKSVERKNAVEFPSVTVSALAPKSIEYCIFKPLFSPKNPVVDYVDKTDEAVQSLAEFSIEKHNADNNKNLHFVNVVSASRTIDSGAMHVIKYEDFDYYPGAENIDYHVKRLSFFTQSMVKEDKFVRLIDCFVDKSHGFLYDIKLEALDAAGEKKTFIAKVWLERSTNAKQLMEFKPLHADLPINAFVKSCGVHV